ncbi:potassium/proton antiporter [Dysgonomonas macrotermitis]|uniref:Potassium/proton antiporter, CPA1 family n=1 Tax=Dysgonomonas macrotermitis TaxID=1346286 RepID=A0A1M5H3Z8_9BACT|nr:potassium/proton antiporter [Dysgonomonas macrotermitis]SHG10613.1 potassium/proton antiporter, CPA1 family [Dysgonomonas macrotermitis]
MTETFLLVLSILFFISILAGRIGGRLGIPALVLFIAVGMAFGSDGIGIAFNNLYLAEAIGTVSLCVILFSGGLNTKFAEIKPVIGQSMLLATMGVILTAAFTGFFAWWLCGELVPALGFSLISAFLLASVMSSTDSAAVFAILGSKNVKLKHNLRSTLECESGSNDPMAYMLTITLISLIKAGGEPNVLMIVFSIVSQIIIGALAGYFIAKFAVKMLNRIKIENDVYYPIIVLTFCIFIFSFTHFIKGNGFLAIYIGGLVIGNSRFVTKRTTFKLFDAISWLSQIAMFLMLGLLVEPHELFPVAVPALVIGLFMIFVARPLSVFISLTPFSKVTFKDKIFISWVGLRGAVPIIFAIYPLTAGIPHARFIFNIVFFITLISILLQGTFLTKVAKWLDLLAPSRARRRLDDFDVDLAEDIGSISTEIVVTDYALRNGNALMNMPLPDDALVVLVKRDDKYFIPKGKTELNVGDKLLVMMNNEDTLTETYENMGLAGINPNNKPLK